MAAGPGAAAPHHGQGSGTTRHVGLPRTRPVQGHAVSASKASIGKHSETLSQAGANMLPGGLFQAPLPSSNRPRGFFLWAQTTAYLHRNANSGLEVTRVVGLCLFRESFEVDDQGAAFWGSCQRAGQEAWGPAVVGTALWCSAHGRFRRGSMCPASFIPLAPREFLPPGLPAQDTHHQHEVPSSR